MSVSRYRTANIVYGSTIGVAVILAVLFDTYAGGMFSVMMQVVAFCAVVAWVIQLMIERRVYKQPSRPLTPTELQRYKVTRILVAIGLVAMVVFAIAS